MRANESGHSLRYATALVMMLGILGYVVYSYAKDYYRSRQVNAEYIALQQEINRLQARNVQLAELLKYFDSESYAESRARLELGLVKPGEKVVVVPTDQAAGDNLNKPASESPDTPESPLRAWWSYFFHRHGAVDSDT